MQEYRSIALMVSNRVDVDGRLDCRASPVSDHVQHSTKCGGLVVLSCKTTVSFVSNESATNQLAATVLLRK